MDLTVKSHIVSKSCISKFSLNQTHNLLAAIVKSADTIAFYYLQSEPLSLQEVFQGTSKPAGNKSTLTWSNDGTYLALGSSQLELWRFDGKKMVPVKTFVQDFVDIKIIVWSPDSQSMAYGGLSKKNTIKIKNIQSGNTQEISIPLVLSGMSYDPFGKYLLLLLRNNIVYVYNSSSLTKIREVLLSPDASPSRNVTTHVEVRTMGWSPDFNHLVCPSLDDNKIALAMDLCRTNNFKIRQVFLGHASSIICAQFNPNLYEYEGDITSILAIGDSCGVVSLWRVGKKIFDQPLIILQSNNENQEVIEDLEWSQSGQILLVNAMKRYINVFVFKLAKFGRQISVLEKTNIIEESYGVSSASEINKKQLEVFSLSSLQGSNQKESHHIYEPELQKQAKSNNQKQQTKKPIQSSTFGSNNFSGLTNKVEYVKVNEQVTIRDKNNKKKIQPAILVRKDQIQKSINQPNLPIPLTTSLHTYSTIGSFQPLKLKPITCDYTILKTGKNNYIELKKLQGYTILKLYQNKDGEKTMTHERVFTGVISWIKPVHNEIYILNMNNLYIVGPTLNLIELPYNLGEVHKITVNKQGDIYYISTKGLIKGFNHQTKNCYTPVPVALQSLLEGIDWKQKPQQSATNAEDKEEQNVNMLEEFVVQKNHNLYLTLQNKRNRYFYCRQTKCWISLQLNSGLFQAGHSLRIAEQEDRLASDFFRQLTNKFLPESSSTSQTPLQQFESNMIYYQRHFPNKQLYFQNLLCLLKELKARNQPAKLRSQIVKYFVDQSSSHFIRDENIRKKVKQLGGNVIEQFILFGQL